MKKIHSFLVAAYMLGGIALMVAATGSRLSGDILNSGGATLAVHATAGEALRGAADEPTRLAQEAVDAYESAAASRQLMLGVLLFTLGGFLHAYQTLREERPVRITARKKKPLTLFWIEMSV